MQVRDGSVSCDTDFTPTDLLDPSDASVCVTLIREDGNERGAWCDGDRCLLVGLGLLLRFDRIIHSVCGEYRLLVVACKFSPYRSMCLKPPSWSGRGVSFSHAVVCKSCSDRCRSGLMVRNVAIHLQSCVREGVG